MLLCADIRSCFVLYQFVVFKPHPPREQSTALAAVLPSLSLAFPPVADPPGVASTLISTPVLLGFLFFLCGVTPGKKSPSLVVRKSFRKFVFCSFLKHETKAIQTVFHLHRSISHSFLSTASKLQKHCFWYRFLPPNSKKKHQIYELVCSRMRLRR